MTDTREQIRKWRLHSIQSIELLETELGDKLKESAEAYRGDLRLFQSAVGALLVGKLYGWRILRIVLAPISYRKYEKILGIRFRDYCQERTALSDKSVGLKIADYMGDFWKVAEGIVSVKGKEQVE
jgi:hypothetical protein